MTRSGNRTSSARWVAVAALLAACGGGERGPAVDDPGVPTAELLVDRHVEARGGAERLQAIETLSMSGRATTGPGREALVSRQVKPPRRIRTEFTFQGVTSVYACDGETCWYVDPMVGVFDAEPMPPSEAAWARQEADALSAIDWQAHGHEIELRGTETIEGRETYELRVTLSSGPSRTVYVDAETALVVRRVTPRIRGDRTLEVQTDFGDLREVDGVVFPHSIRSRARGSDEVLHIVVESIEINAPIDDSRFEMPGR